MIEQNLHAAADEQNEEYQIDVMSSPDPKRKALRIASSRMLHAGRHWRKTHSGPLNVSCDRRCQERQRDDQEFRTANVHYPSPASRFVIRRCEPRPSARLHTPWAMRW